MRYLANADQSREPRPYLARSLQKFRLDVKLIGKNEIGNQMIEDKHVMNGLTDKFESLKQSLAGYTAEGLIVAFSGGVDSGFLVWAAEEARKERGGKLLALTTNSESMPKHDKDDVIRFVSKLGVKHIWKESYEVEDDQYLKNDSMRCYYCKSELFTIAKQVAAENDCKRIAYGYSASDMSDIRPGHKAAVENDILYPLATHGFTKEEIRELMRVNGFDLYDKPSSPCLSSRIMRGVQITKQDLRNVDDLEGILREGGMKVFRLRVHEINGKHFLRLETAPGEMMLALQLRDKLTTEAKKRGYVWVTLDLDGYRTGGGTF